jgi:hypothetical protein
LGLFISLLVLDSSLLFFRVFDSFEVFDAPLYCAVGSISQPTKNSNQSDKKAGTIFELLSLSVL